MEEARIVVSTFWQQRLQNERYKNWLKVTHALSILCTGIRPYIEREAKAFHGLLTTRLHGSPLCTCTYTRHPYHNTITCLWAKELLNYHTKGKPTWNQSNASLWHDPNVGHWEVAKLYMPYGCAKGNSCAETDATGLLNLLLWCSYYKIDRTLVERLKDTRNACAHAATQELNAAETNDAFLSMKNFLRDAELIGDADATNALNDIIALEIDDLIDFEDLETKVVSELKQSMTSMKDELVARIDSTKDQEDIHANDIKEEILHVKTMISYCMKIGQERKDVLLNIQTVLCEIQDQMEVLLSRLENRNEERSREHSNVEAMKHSLKHLSLWAISLFLRKVLRMRIPRKVTLLLFLLAAITTLDENLDEIGCNAITKSEDAHDLMEIDFTEHLNRVREGFVGRQWLFKDISDSLENDEFKGVMIIAAPGFGKSSLMSNLICSKLSSFSLHSRILGYHLCIHSYKKTQNGAVFVRNLASMIAERLGDYGSFMKDKFIQRVLNYEQCSSDPTACFEQGILSPLLKLQLRFLEPTMYIVIDALDECYNENDQDKGTSIVNILSNNMKMFPKWLKVIVTSRNVTDIRRTFSSLDVLDFFPEDPRNLQDIERFILSRSCYSFLSQMKSFFVKDFSIQAMVNKSQGNFLYIKLVLEYLQTKGASAATWNSLPTSINSIYKEFFERKFNVKEKFRGPRKIFEILVATLSPLTTEELYDVFVNNLKDTEVLNFEYGFLSMLEDLSMYLSSIQENQIVTVFHSSLTEWLTSASNRGGRFYVDVKKGNQLIADYYFKKIHESSVNITPQFVYNLATYIVRGSSIKQHVNDFNNLDQKLVRVSDISTNSTALHMAAGEENKRTMALLLHFFDNVDIEDNRGRTPAFYAVRFKREANLRLLYQKGASLAQMTSTLTCGNPNTEEDDVQYCENQMCGYSLLHVASQRGHHKTVKFLLKNNASVSTLSGSGFSALHLAAKYNHSETMTTLIDHGAVPDSRCLYYAALHGNSMAVRILLENGAEDTCMNCSEMSNGYFKGKFQFSNLEDSQNYRQDCNTALHIAAIKNMSSITKMLLKSNKRAVHCINFYGKDPLLEAVDKSHFQVTKLLLKSGANPSSICHFYSILDSLPLFCPCGYTPLHMAAQSGAAVITNLLLKYKADYNARDCEGLQPVHVASCHGHTDILSILVKKGADINSRGPNDMTPIHYACQCQNDGIFDKMFELGANGTAITSDGNTPLHCIIQQHSINEDSLVLFFPENVDIQDNKGHTPAFYATMFDRVGNLRLLYQKGASLAQMTPTLTCGNPNTEEDDVQYCENQMCGYSLLHVASQRGNHKTVKFLLKNNASVSTLSGSGFRALHLAAKYNHFETMKTLMEHGAVPDGRCLYYAALHGNSMAVRIFLENGAEDTCMNCSEMSNGYSKRQFQFSNLEDRQNYRQDCNTALHIAAIENLSSIAKVLLKSYKKTVHCINFYGKDPLLEAVDKSHSQVTELLLKSGANPSSVFHYYSILDYLPLSCPCGYTPLHMAAQSGAAFITNLLLKYKADYNARDCEGLQPIHVASCHGHTDILSILVKKGANINSKGPNDMTPIHYACKYQNDGIFDKLFELGANGTALTSDGNTPVYYIIQKHSIDEEFFLMDPYVSIPIEPIDANFSVIENPFKHKYPWMISIIRFLASFTKGKSYDLESMNRLNLMKVFIDDIILNVSKSMLGGLEVSSWKFVALTSPLFYAYDIGMLSDQQKFKDELESKSESYKVLFKALTRINTNCSSMILLIENILIYYFDNLLSIGNDVNCKDSETSSPLFTYLRQGGRNMAKVLVKHGVIIDIQCGELFEDSAFHLAAYHKLHYLQYISVFRDPVKWKEYQKEENALFDYLFDEYDRLTEEEQVKIVRVRDGPVTKAIKSHPQGYKVIDECLDGEGYTALHRAAQGGNVVAVKHFLNWGANATKESPEGFDALTLTIWYAVKYRPYFNFHKLNLLTSLEIEFASFTASAILSHLTRDKPFYVGCDNSKKVPTLLHLAATRGMWRFIDHLFVARDRDKVTGLTVNCPTKDNITPMYLAKLHGGDDCDWDNPWCKVVGVLLKYGASMIYPDALTEYSLVFNFLFHKVPGRLDLHFDKKEITMLENVAKEVAQCSDFEDFAITDVFESDIVFVPTNISNIYVYRNGISKFFYDTTRPLFKAADEVERIEQFFDHFLTSGVKDLKSIFVYLKKIDDIKIRRVRTAKYQDQPRQISEEQDKSDLMNPGKSLDDIEQEKFFTNYMRKRSISFPPHKCTAASLNLDMCSPEAAAKMFNTIESCLDNKRQVFKDGHKTLIQELKTAKQAFQQYLLKLGRSDSSVKRILKSYEKNLTCPMKTITYKYLRMKFLLHTIRFWDRQVRKISLYPSIAKFVAQRIQDIFLNENAQEMTSFILQLTSENPSEKYEYLRMLRFTKAPMFDKTVN